MLTFRIVKGNTCKGLILETKKKYTFSTKIDCVEMFFEINLIYLISLNLKLSI